MRTFLFTKMAIFVVFQRGIYESIALVGFSEEGKKRIATVRSFSAHF